MIHKVKKQITKKNIKRILNKKESQRKRNKKKQKWNEIKNIDQIDKIMRKKIWKINWFELTIHGLEGQHLIHWAIDTDIYAKSNLLKVVTFCA